MVLSFGIFVRSNMGGGKVSNFFSEESEGVRQQYCRFLATS